MLGLLKLIPANIWKGLSGALVASVAALAGLWYTNTLQEDIERLQSDLERSRASVKELSEFKDNVLENRVLYQRIDSRIQVATKELSSRYDKQRGDIDEISKTKSAKGINRVVPSVIIDRLCSDVGAEYCYSSSDSGNTSESEDAMHKTSP